MKFYGVAKTWKIHNYHKFTNVAVLATYFHVHVEKKVDPGCV